MPIPTELVGWPLPRPMNSRRAYEAYDHGDITFDALQAEQDEAAADSIRRFERVGEPIVTDGEQRESSFATYPITDTLAGTGLAEFFAIFDDGHHRQLPRLTGGPFRYNVPRPSSSTKAIATHDVKQAVIAPSMLMLLYPLEGELDGYYAASSSSTTSATRSRRTSASASRPARCASRSTSPRAGWPTRTTRATRGRTRTCSTSSSISTTAVIDRFSPDERRNIGIHTCPAASTRPRCPTSSC